MTLWYLGGEPEVNYQRTSGFDGPQLQEVLGRRAGGDREGGRLQGVAGRVLLVAYVVGLVAAVVVLDVVLFRHHTWARLLANIGTVLLFAAFYLRFHTAFGGR